MTDLMLYLATFRGLAACFRAHFTRLGTARTMTKCDPNQCLTCSNGTCVANCDSEAMVHYTPCGYGEVTTCSDTTYAQSCGGQGAPCPDAEHICPPDMYCVSSMTVTTYYTCQKWCCPYKKFCPGTATVCETGQDCDMDDPEHPPLKGPPAGTLIVISYSCEAGCIA